MNHHLRLVGTPALCHHCRAPMFGPAMDVCPVCVDFLAEMSQDRAELTAAAARICDFPGCRECAAARRAAQNDPSDLRFSEVP